MTTYPNVSDTNYFTNRALENKEGEKTGKVIMWRMKGEEEYHLVLKCPFCGHDQELVEKFAKKPYRPRCQNCAKSILISKLKLKKEKK